MGSIASNMQSTRRCLMNNVRGGEKIQWARHRTSSVDEREFFKLRARDVAIKSPVWFYCKTHTCIRKIHWQGSPLNPLSS